MVVVLVFVSCQTGVQRRADSAHYPVMRKEAVFTVLLNVKLFSGMKCTIAQDPRYIRFSAFEGNQFTHYNLRVSLFPFSFYERAKHSCVQVSNAKIAQQLVEEICANIPS